MKILEKAEGIYRQEPVFKKKGFVIRIGPVWDTQEHREKMHRIDQIMAGKAICMWPRSYHINLPYLQGKKLLTAINLFIGDRM